MALKTKKIFLINLILVIVFSISCKTSKSNMVKPKFVVNPMRVHNIELRRHQSIPIEYLKKNPSQKGLVLNHYLGTGKTFTSLAFCEEFPNEKTYIFAPNFLESNWLSHMDKMGIKDKSRYQFFSYERASKSILKLDLTNSIIIVDEVHRLIEKIKSGDEVTRKKYSKLYQKLRSAKKILALTGTPVFTEISDVAFLLNLVSGKDLLPFNDRLFNDQFTEVKKGKSFFRGHLSESHIWMIGLPFVLASLPLAFLTPSTAMVAGVYFGGLAAGFGILPLANALTPIEKSPMRKFKPGEIQDHAQKFISFYDFRSGKSEDYPQFK